MASLDPISVSLYSPREGCWAWSVDFETDALSRAGVVPGFPQAVRAILDSFENVQTGSPGAAVSSDVGA